MNPELEAKLKHIHETKEEVDRNFFHYPSEHVKAATGSNRPLSIQTILKSSEQNSRREKLFRDLRMLYDGTSSVVAPIIKQTVVESSKTVLTSPSSPSDNTTQDAPVEEGEQRQQQEEGKEDRGRESKEISKTDKMRFMYQRLDASELPVIVISNKFQRALLDRMDDINEVQLSYDQVRNNSDFLFRLFYSIADNVPISVDLFNDINRRIMQHYNPPSSSTSSSSSSSSGTQTSSLFIETDQYRKMLSRLDNVVWRYDQLNFLLDCVIRINDKYRLKKSMQKGGRLQCCGGLSSDQFYKLYYTLMPTNWSVESKCPYDNWEDFMDRFRAWRVEFARILDFFDNISKGGSSSSSSKTTKLPQHTIIDWLPAVPETVKKYSEDFLAMYIICQSSEAKRWFFTAARPKLPIPSIDGGRDRHSRVGSSHYKHPDPIFREPLMTEHYMTHNDAILDLESRIVAAEATINGSYNSKGGFFYFMHLTYLSYHKSIPGITSTVEVHENIKNSTEWMSDAHQLNLE